VSTEVEGNLEDQSSFEAALAAMNAAIEKPAEQPVVPEAAPVAPSPTPAVPAPTPEPAAPPPSAKELERIAALDAREARVREAEARAREIESREASIKARESAQWDAFARDPVGFVQRMKPDLGPAEAAKVAESLYMHALGDKAPPEHRQRQEVAKVTTEVKTEVDQLRTELQELRAARAREAEQAEMAAYRAELRSGVPAAEAPIVHNLLQRNPARAEELLFEVARREAVESKRRGEAEPVVLTPAQAATKLEAILKAQREELYGPDAATPAPAQNAPQSSPSPTLSNRDASIQPTRATPDLTDDFELRKAALKAIGLDPDLAWKD
jgi:hypothetical protein